MPTNANPDTNQFRCNACGRPFNTQSELNEHELECRMAKMATPEGARELHEQDQAPHEPNDAGSKEHKFQHGTKQPD